MNKFIKGFVYALNGIWHASITQLNFRVHLVCAIVAVYAGYALHISNDEWLWIIFCIGILIWFVWSGFSQPWWSRGDTWR